MRRKKEFMKFHDISLPLHDDMVVWPGDVPFTRKENRSTGITSRLNFSTHTGTHIDAPKHFLFEKGSVDAISLQKLIGKCKVLEIRAKQSEINLETIARFNILRGDRIIFKTGNSKLLTRKRFTSHYISLSLESAKYLVKKKISLLGIDYYGIEAKSAPGHPVHKTLLRAGIVILEGLNLSDVKPGEYNLAALPLKLKGADGSPARAVLWK